MENGEWIEHDGKGMPVDGETMVQVRYRDGLEGSILRADFLDDENPARSNWWYSEVGPYEDITHYRIVSEEQAK